MGLDMLADNVMELCEVFSVLRLRQKKFCKTPVV